MREKIWSFETSIWHQELVRTENELVLERFYKGIDLADLNTRIDLLRELAAPFTTPRVDELGVCRFQLDTEDTLFNILHSSVAADHILELFYQLGQYLAQVKVPTPDNADIPTAWKRLEKYLSADYPEEIEDILVILGDDTVAHATTLMERINQVPEKVVGLGGVGIGGIYVNDGVFVIPCGPEAGVIPIEFDLAWILGELTELEHAFLRRGQSGDLVARAGNALVEGYLQAGRAEIDTEILTILSALRTLLHYFDFSMTYPDQFPDDEHCRFVRWLVSRAYSLTVLEESHV